MRWLLLALALALLIGLGLIAVVYVPVWFAPETADVPVGTETSADAGRRIRATLFYVAEDGLALEALDAEVPYGPNTAEQARRLLEAQLQPAPAPYAQAIAEGTSIRQIFLTDSGDAFVDLSKEAVTNHRGGSLDELFAVYAIVNTLTVNLPAVKHVQILVDGQEVDTLAGHVDLRHPLARNLTWVGARAPRTPGTEGTAPPPDAPPTGTPAVPVPTPTATPAPPPAAMSTAPPAPAS